MSLLVCSYVWRRKGHQGKCLLFMLALICGFCTSLSVIIKPGFIMLPFFTCISQEENRENVKHINRSCYISLSELQSKVCREKYDSYFRKTKLPLLPHFFTHFKDLGKTYIPIRGQVNGIIHSRCAFFLNSGALCLPWLALNFQTYLIINIHTAQRFRQGFGCWNQVLSYYRSEL